VANDLAGKSSAKSNGVKPFLQVDHAENPETAALRSPVAGVGLKNDALAVSFPMSLDPESAFAIGQNLVEPPTQSMRLHQVTWEHSDLNVQ
jgi:hypothetical protein